MDQETKLVPPTRDDIREAMSGRGASVTLEPAVGGFYIYWTNQRAVGRTFYPRKGDIHDAAAVERKTAREIAQARGYQWEKTPAVPR